jgi:DNA (cytosine-5)-methyltransferase 1
MNYYNEHDPKAAAWLRELIACGHIPAGVVDERDIQKVQPYDLTQYTQCHFFAGIGGWLHALQLAGWPDSQPVGTGSCPCQPFSDAGRGLAEKDPRHLWPVWFQLISDCRKLGQPWTATLFGEQVASKAALQWLDGVFFDLEGEGYACGAADLCAAGLNAPHIRQRLCWVADSNVIDDDRTRCCPSHESGQWESASAMQGQRALCGLADSAGQRRDRGAGMQGENGRASFEASGGMEPPFQSRLEGLAGNGHHWNESGRVNENPAGSTPTPSRPWDSFDLLPCTDGKARRIEPGTFPLAHGIPGRVGLLRGYGNAIVPQVAAEFVTAYLEITPANFL